MQNYQRKILNALVDAGWGREEIVAEPNGFATEHWRMVSVRDNWGSQFFLTFLVDPQWTGKKRAGVWIVSACATVPNGRLEAQRGFAVMGMTKGNFDEKLLAFVEELNEARQNL